MIVGTVLCTECGPVVNTVNPNGGERLCLSCGNSHCYGASICNKCGNKHTHEILYLSGKEDEICPKCHKGVLHFCI